MSDELQPIGTHLIIDGIHAADCWCNPLAAAPDAPAPRTEPIDTLHEAIDATMPALADIDPDWQSRWSTAALLLNEIERRGYTLAAQAAAAPDAPAPPEHEHYWIDGPDDEAAWYCAECGVTEYPAACPDPSIHVAPAPQALDVERFIDLWVMAHSSNRRAGQELYAMVEEWWDANRDDPYPLPRVFSLPSETGDETRAR